MKRRSEGEGGAFASQQEGNGVGGGGEEREPAVEWTAARSSSRPARTRVRWVPVGGVGRARRPGGGGTLCLALPTPRTDSSGAQGLWKVNLQPNHS